MLLHDPAIARTISLCTRTHRDIWQIASRKIVSNIEAAAYVLIVPEEDYSLFKTISPAEFTVVSEDKYTHHFSQTLRRHLPPDNQGRFGWYLQQLIKLAVLAEGKGDELMLIWDSDTIPLRKLKFTDGTRLSYYSSREWHPPYFKQIKALTGLERRVGFSFIAQCFPIRADWFQGFRSFLEHRSGQHWLDALIQSIDFRESSGLSEYELLGTYLARFHRDSICLKRGRWQRLGNSLIGGVNNLDHPAHASLLQAFDYISFETWDPCGAPSPERTLSRRHEMRVVEQPRRRYSQSPA